MKIVAIPSFVRMSAKNNVCFHCQRIFVKESNCFGLRRYSLVPCGDIILKRWKMTKRNSFVAPLPLAYLTHTAGINTKHSIDIETQLRGKAHEMMCFLSEISSHNLQFALISSLPLTLPERATELEIIINQSVPMQCHNICSLTKSWVQIIHIFKKFLFFLKPVQM